MPLADAAGCLSVTASVVFEFMSGRLHCVARTGERQAQTLWEVCVLCEPELAYLDLSFLCFLFKPAALICTRRRTSGDARQHAASPLFEYVSSFPVVTLLNYYVVF